MRLLKQSRDFSQKFYVVTGLLLALCVSSASADQLNAAQTDTYEVPFLETNEIVIDGLFDDWAISEDSLLMGEETWEANGGTWGGEEDLTAELHVLYDESNVYFALMVTDDEYVAQAAAPWENDGVQIAIDTSAGEIPPGWPNDTTHFYNFSIADGWQPEAGPYMGDAELSVRRDDNTMQNLYEWRMPLEIIADAGTTLTPGMEIAFAIINNDSDLDAPGQGGWVGWGSETIVFGKNPEEMQTIVLGGTPTAVEAESKLTTTWGALKKLSVNGFRR